MAKTYHVSDQLEKIIENKYFSKKNRKEKKTRTQIIDELLRVKK